MKDNKVSEKEPFKINDYLMGIIFGGLLVLAILRLFNVNLILLIRGY